MHPSPPPLTPTLAVAPCPPLFSHTGLEGVVQLIYEPQTELVNKILHA